MWKKRLIALAGILSFALIAFITYEVTRLREAPFTSAPSVGVEGRTIVVRFEEHPPWAMLHAIACVEVEEQHTVQFSELYSIVSFGRTRLSHLRPIVLENLAKGKTQIRCLMPEGFRLLGEVEVNDRGDFVWFPSEADNKGH